MRMSNETITPRLTPGKLWALVVLALMAALVGVGLRASTAAADAAANGSFSFALASTTVTEGQTAFITVNRAQGTAGTQVINLTVTPNAPATYADVNNFGSGSVTQITFAPGVTSRTVDATVPDQGLPTVDNLATETSPRTIQIVLASVQSGGAAIGAQNTHTLNIIDNDGPPKYSFQAGTSSVAEGSPSGSFTFDIPIIRTGAIGGTDVVNCVLGVGSTATGGGTDYSFSSQLITFNPNEPLNTVKNCQVTIVRDALSEPGGETVVLNLTLNSGFSGGAGAFSTHTLTITDDDGPGTLQFKHLNYPAAEGSVGQFAITRTGGTGGTITATCGTVQNGTATAGVDYNATADSTQLVWGSGDATDKFCGVTILADADSGNGETFGITLTSANLGSPAAATVTITDGAGTGTLQFSSSSYSGSENGGGIQLTVTRTGSSVGLVTVDIATTSVGSTATAGVDYTTAATTLTWPNGDGTPKYFTVFPIDDAVAEPTEVVNVVLTNATGGAVIGSPSTAAVQITDNESPGPVVLSVSPAAGTILGGTPVTITGTNFTGATAVTFDGIACTSIVVVSSNTITCVTPAHPAGLVEVVVTTPFGISPTAGSANNYSYTGGPTITSLNPATGPATGNTIVTISGTGFTSSGTTVRFAGVLAVHSWTDANTIVAVSPAHSAGVVDVTVTTPGGTSPNTSADDFTYTGSSAPVVTSLTPNTGVVGTTVVISGSGFNDATAVTFGGVAATFTVNSDGQITTSVPAGTALGVVDVRVTTPAGMSANTTADNFTNTSQGNLITYTLYFRFTLIVWTGPNGISALTALRGLETPDNPNTNNISLLVGAIWRFDPQTQAFKGYFPGSDGVPRANDFTTLTAGQAYFFALINPGTVTWTTLGAN